MYWKYYTHYNILYAYSRVSNNLVRLHYLNGPQRVNVIILYIISSPPRTFSSHDGHNNIIYIGNANRVNDSNNNNRDIVKKKIIKLCHRNVIRAAAGMTSR